uniref:hypothetical protein n=1 Tax=Phyllosticta yuccae TaxID=1151444 RepID=UPI0027A03157|nr:hypothetical protein QLP54_mgp10 [Phyllosticta yuccae]WGC90071.1 hypothetical protein [Phyllosticta yuccae]
MRRVSIIFRRVSLNSLASSTVGKFPLCKLRCFTCYKPNKHITWVAETECFVKVGLPSLIDKVSRINYAEDNKPETQRCDLFSKCIPSRICRYIQGMTCQNIKSMKSWAYHNIRSMICCREALHHSSKGVPKGFEQAAKARTLSRNYYKPRDLIAYGSNPTRKRSFHSSTFVGAKGNSVNTLDNKVTSDNTIKSEYKTKTKKPSVKYPLVDIVAQKLNNYLTKDGKYNKIIHLMSDPYFLIACYNEIKGKPGNMTKGTTKETLDGIKFEWFEKIANELKTGIFDFKPRVEIPKPNSDKKRPLTIAAPRDKVVQKALQVIIEAIWEDIFHDCSHGFRPGRSVHSALAQIYYGGSNFIWAIQGDISKCFDNIPHEIVIKLLKNKIVDPRFLELQRKFLETGIMDPKTKKINKTSLGIPQGGILSPILCNIVLHQFDDYIQRQIKMFNKGKARSHNREYQKLEYRRRKAKTMLERREYLFKMRRVGNVDKLDPNFKRMKYIRYADDFVILINGTRNESQMVKNNCKEYLNTHCGVNLNEEKTIITNLKDNNFMFLGAEIVKLRNPTFLRKNQATNSIVATPRLLIKAPINKLLDKLKLTGFIRQDNNQIFHPKHVGSLVNLSHYDIISYYNSKIYGILNFYSFASNLNKLGRLIWYLQASCGLTLARKYKLYTMRATFRKFGKLLTCPNTGKSLHKPNNLKVKHNYQKSKRVPRAEELLDISWASKLTETNFGKACIICGVTEGIEMHHNRSVKDVRAKMKTGNSTYAQWVGATMRKQIPMCQYHHELYHKGQLT